MLLLYAGKPPVERIPDIEPVLWGFRALSLQWRHNGHSSVSNHQPHDCLLNQTQIKENINALRHWPLCGEYLQMASNAENVSIDGVIMDDSKLL